MQKKVSLVLIHGWGCGNQAWQPLLDYLRPFADLQLIELPGFGEQSATVEYQLQNILPFIAEQIPDKSWILGWSLGGMLAVQLASHYPQKIAGVITLAANARLVAADGYATAMPLATNQAFNQSFSENPAQTLKTFSGLMVQGAEDERGLLKKIRSIFSVDLMDKNLAAQALQLLSELDNRQALAALSQPCLHLLAEGDALVPAAAAESLCVINPAHQVKLIANSAHAIQWCYPQLVADAIYEFIRSSALTPDILFKKRVARNFSRASQMYDQTAQVQFTSGKQLLDKFSEGFLLSESAKVLDLGAGTGRMLPWLAEKFPGADLLALDLSFAMLQQASKNRSVCSNFITADAESLPIANRELDLIYSNFSLQWCQNLDQVFSEMSRCLKKNGEILLTTLVDKSLYELRSAWAALGEAPHVIDFAATQTLLDQVSQQFEIVQYEKVTLAENFLQVSDLLKSLKAIGATYVGQTKDNVGLSGRKKFALLAEAYEEFRRDGQYPLTYEVLFIRAKKRE